MAETVPGFTQPITTYQRRNFLLDVTYVDPDTGLPIDITGRGAKLQVRATYGATTPLLDLTCSIPVGSDGRITGSATPTQMDFAAGNYYYDLIVYDIEDPDSDTAQVMAGQFFLIPTVSEVI